MFSPVSIIRALRWIHFGVFSARINLALYFSLSEFYDNPNFQKIVLKFEILCSKKTGGTLEKNTVPLHSNQTMSNPEVLLRTSMKARRIRCSCSHGRCIRLQIVTETQVQKPWCRKTEIETSWTVGEQSFLIWWTIPADTSINSTHVIQQRLESCPWADCAR